jgi:ketosteroid isomerase-like protein
MGAKQNLELIEQHLEATRARDEDRYAAAYAEDAIVRMTGVPRSLGGVIEGRQAILDNFRNMAPGTFLVRQMFGDDSHVCVVGKLSSTFGGTQFLRGNDKPFATFECIVYRIEGGRIQEQTAYANWMDVYVQTGLIDVASLTA